MTYSPIAVRLGIKNEPEEWHVENARRLANELLEETRELLQVPIYVNSWFRSKSLNNVIGGAKNSFHLLGLAVDFESPGVSNQKLFQKIVESDLPYDQAIAEFFSDSDPSAGWIHLGYSDNPRRQVLKAFKANNQTTYALL